MPINDTPVITALRVIPVAGRDSMLLNLSGAHGPFFTRNILILTDSAGRTGVGEVPGGETVTMPAPTLPSRATSTTRPSVPCSPTAWAVMPSARVTSA